MFLFTALTEDRCNLSVQVPRAIVPCDSTVFLFSRLWLHVRSRHVVIISGYMSAHTIFTVTVSIYNYLGVTLYVHEVFFTISHRTVTKPTVLPPHSFMHDAMYRTPCNIPIQTTHRKLPNYLTVTPGIWLATVKLRLHDTTCCQTGCTTGLTTGCIV